MSTAKLLYHPIANEVDFPYLLSIKCIKATLTNSVVDAPLQYIRRTIANRVVPPYLLEIKWAIANGAVDALSIWDITISTNLLINAPSFKQAVSLRENSRVLPRTQEIWSAQIHLRLQYLTHQHQYTKHKQNYFVWIT